MGDLLVKLKERLGDGAVQRLRQHDTRIQRTERQRGGTQVTNTRVVVSGGGSSTGASDAADLTYTPAVLTDWDGDADPGDVDNALDQLAERVDDLEGAGSSSTLDFASIWAMG